VGPVVQPCSLQPGSSSSSSSSSRTGHHQAATRCVRTAGDDGGHRFSCLCYCARSSISMTLVNMLRTNVEISAAAANLYACLLFEKGWHRAAALCCHVVLTQTMKTCKSQGNPHLKTAQHHN
jgi:hypothetical protein